MYLNPLKLRNVAPIVTLYAPPVSTVFSTNPQIAASQLPSPAYPLGEYPGQAAWIDGDWKLHRITNKKDKVSWELYELTTDPAEENNVIAREGKRSRQMQRKFEEWWQSVVRSLNRADYATVPQTRI